MSTVASRRALLMPHEARQALIRQPFPITYILPVKRWGGVQVAPDNQWDQVAERFHFRRKYADNFDAQD